MCHACTSLWEACPFLNGDGGGTYKEGIDGKGEETGGEKGGETGWYVKQMRKCYLKKEWICIWGTNVGNLCDQLNVGEKEKGDPSINSATELGIRLSN